MSFTNVDISPVGSEMMYPAPTTCATS
jgi:hypothetical protein